MNRILAVLALTGVLAVALGTSANAQLVYSNGPINGELLGFTLGFGFEVSDSFTVSSPTNLSSVTAGIWNFPGDTDSSIDWAIGSTTYGTDVASGVAATSDAFQYTNGQDYNIYEDSFAVNGTLAPGTYWLTLSGATVTNGDPSYWDDNGGPSVAFDSSVGSLVGFNGNPGSNSESFQVFGSPSSSTPEPGAYAMLAGLGLSGLTILRRRRKA